MERCTSCLSSVARYEPVKTREPANSGPGFYRCNGCGMKYVDEPTTEGVTVPTTEPTPDATGASPDDPFAVPGL